MEAGKCVKAPHCALIMGVLVLGLLVVQTPVEAKSCCKSTVGRNCYNACRLRFARQVCASTCSCKIVGGNRCPRGYPKVSGFLNSEEFEQQTDVEDQASQINEYCKLGCVSSECGDNMITTPRSQTSDEEVQRCNNACLELCNKHYNIAVAVTA
ncbi:hypothetical protein C5167_036343 [Papaver somniferum]|uniref:Acidic protein n=1 Tax=Papaver somniferum TaxID=3469 RepID=A0A4Y7I7A1_PAPSO|nr:alpha-1-purothionin-like [Papaver somniferum]XP_026428970.1 alpha-1-purothionin-like [Papaver somniferum]RZC43396.1 hypothetical protein C5167_036346 [Papaver somniferum]RZC43398.1 hypothetical protein C5167_036343 [Papaver somniferum]